MLTVEDDMGSLSFLKLLHDRCVDLSMQLCFDKKNYRQLLLVGLYTTLLELTACIVTLIDQKKFAGVPTLFRSILEAYVELRNLYSDEEYVNYMEANYHSQWLKILAKAKSTTNPYLSYFSTWDLLDSQITEHQSAISKLQEEGYSPLSISDRFARASLAEEYYSIYNFLCSEAHNDIRSLIMRHVDIEENDFQVVCYKDQPISDFTAHLESTADILIHSSDMLHSLFNHSVPDEINQFRKDLNDIISSK